MLNGVSLMRTTPDRASSPANASSRGRLGGVSQGLKEQRRRERLREYDTALNDARSALAVLAQFVRGRESRASGESLEEAFAAGPLDAAGAAPLPAAIWVALRHADIDAALDHLMTLSTRDFLIASHEQLDDAYKLVTVQETRPLPDVDRLPAQLAEFLQVPADVVAMVAGWGPDDPRTAAEIDTLLDQRFGSPHPDAPAPAARSGPASTRSDAAGLIMSAGEFSALLTLTPEQRQVLATLVRQTTITITAGE